jgi:hypothetical protein
VSLPTLTDLKAHLNKTSTTADDAELADMLDAAVDVVEGIVGPVTTSPVTETHRVSSDVLVLRRMPVAGLVSVSPGSLADFALDVDSGLLRRVDGYGFVGPVTVTYSVGRPMVPAAISLAILIIAGHLWETQRGTSPSALSLQQPGAEPLDAPVAGYAIPNRARDLLARYVRVSIA